jgi:hypothetical protein
MTATVSGTLLLGTEVHARGGDAVRISLDKLPDRVPEEIFSRVEQRLEELRDRLRAGGAALC